MPGGIVNFNAESGIPSLKGKVILVTGGTAGCGRASVEALAKHDPEHIYFTGRNRKSAESIIAAIRATTPNASLTFLEMDMSSFASIKAATTNAAKFTHDRLDILICNAGVMETPPQLSRDGFEIHIAVNHLGHALLVRELLPVLLRTAEAPGSDVRVVFVSSNAWQLRSSSAGIWFDKLNTRMDKLLDSWARYGQSKLANLVYAAELARRYPKLTAVSVHPGLVKTDNYTNLPFLKRNLGLAVNFVMGVLQVSPETGALNQLWAAAGAKKSDLTNGGFYMPVAELYNHKLDKVALSQEFAMKLWNWTEDALDGVRG